MIFQKLFPRQNTLKQKIAIFLIFSFGIVSMLGDIVYEGAMSIYGIFLNDQRVTTTNIGIVLGSAELVGYIFRIISGFLVDRFRCEWILVFVGYGLLLCIPALGFFDGLEMIVAMIFLERIAKHLRAPARDSLISSATRRVGSGLGFGILETLDQIGAFLGPLIFTLSLLYFGSYSYGFVCMLLPIAVMMMVLLNVYQKIPHPHILEKASKCHQERRGNLSAIFFYYLVFVFATMIGFATFPLFSIHIQNTQLLAKEWIPLIYSAIMLIDGLVAIPMGKCYDHFGSRLLSLIPLLTIATILCVFSSQMTLILIGVLLWGVVLGMYEVIFKAHIAQIIDKSSRGRAYAFFGIICAIALFANNAIIGALYQKNMLYIFIFVFVMQSIALYAIYLHLTISEKTKINKNPSQKP